MVHICTCRQILIHINYILVVKETDVKAMGKDPGGRERSVTATAEEKASPPLHMLSPGSLPHS